MTQRVNSPTGGGSGRNVRMTRVLLTCWVLAAALFLTAIPTAWATPGELPPQQSIPTPEKEKEHKDKLTPTPSIVWTATPTPTVTATTIPMVLPETGRPSNTGGISVLFALGALLLCAGSALAIRVYKRGSPPEA